MLEMRLFSGISWRIFHVSWHQVEGSDARREAENEKRAPHDAAPSYVRKLIL